MSVTYSHIREGSSLYYSLLWTDPDVKMRVDKRLGLIKALVTTLDDVQEPQVAEKKIHWWHEELQRLNDGNPRHPATQQSQEYLQGQQAAQAACLDLISAVSTLRFTPFETTEASEANLILSYRARLALLGHALSEDTTDLDTGTHPEISALAFAQYEQLARLPGLIHRGFPVFSDEMYQQFSVRPHDLAEHIRTSRAPAEQQPESTSAPGTPSSAANHLKGIPVVTEKPGRHELLAQAIENNHSSLHKAVGDSTVEQRYRRAPLLPIWRLLVLRRHQLEMWSRRQPDLLRERTTLTPLAKLFRAWQHRR